jgi:digeranylgeranylglycerophospholipid reductase
MEKINNNTAENKYFETIIIGAGPAGLIAGWHLENALILDQKQKIGVPVICGEGVARKALERQGIKPDSAWISVTIDSIQTIMPDGKSFGEFRNEPGYVLDRTKFEKFLASKCKCKIQLNTKVVNIELKDDIFQITTNNNEVFKSKYIIGADGPNSITRKKFFQEKINFIPAIEYVVKLEKEIQTNVIKIFFDNEKYIDGYAWIFPKSKNMANIGLGGKGNLIKTFNEFLENTIKPNYGNYELLKNKSGIIPFDDTKISDNEIIMLVGDA